MLHQSNASRRDCGHASGPNRLADSRPVPTHVADDTVPQISISSHLRLLIAFDAGLVPPFIFIERITVDAMKRARIHPAMIHAYGETGLILRQGTRRRAPIEDLVAWNAAVDNWERINGQRAPQRWVEDAEFWRMAE